MKLIGLTGFKRSGKDAYGAHLIAQGYESYSFAGPIRCAASCMFGLPLSVFEGTNPNREEVDPFWGFSPRQMLQLIGTEGGRELFRPDLWIKRAELRWHELRADYEADLARSFGELPKGMVVTDVRFANEAEWIHKEGGKVLRIDRPGIVASGEHASEAGLPEELVDGVIANHGTLEDLYMVGDLVVGDAFGET